MRTSRSVLAKGTADRWFGFIAQSVLIYSEKFADENFQVSACLVACCCACQRGRWFSCSTERVAQRVPIYSEKFWE